MTDTSPLAQYLAECAGAGRAADAGFVAYLASLEQIASVAPEVSAAIVAELADQRSSLKMIASENYSSLAVQLAQGNLFTDKYAEGIPNHRFYAGCDNVDAVESLAAELACELFGADHAYMQPPLGRRRQPRGLLGHPRKARAGAVHGRGGADRPVQAERLPVG